MNRTEITIVDVDTKDPQNYLLCLQVRSKDSQVKTQLVLWIFILFKVTR